MAATPEPPDASGPPPLPKAPANVSRPPEPPRSAPILRPSDAELVERTRAGDKDAFGQLVRRHQARLHRLIGHVVRSSSIAEELTQEVFVRAYRALGQFDGRSEPFTWLYRIALNLALNERRRACHKYETNPDPNLMARHEDKSSTGTPADQAMRAELYATLMKGIDELSELLRTTLLLVTIDGLSHDQAAAVLGIPAGTVAWRIHEARKKLAVHLDDHGHGRPPSSTSTTPKHGASR